jgi:hypothetical protein
VNLLEAKVLTKEYKDALTVILAFLRPYRFLLWGLCGEREEGDYLENERDKPDYEANEYYI